VTRGSAHPGEEGTALLAAGVALAVVGLALVLVLDLTAYLVAASRAQAAADAAALAAVTHSDPRGRTPGDPRAAARRVAAVTGARVIVCRCAPGTTEVSVTVVVDVRAIAADRFFGTTVHATASARLVLRAGPLASRLERITVSAETETRCRPLAVLHRSRRTSMSGSLLPRSSRMSWNTSSDS